jgi:hypothetical protein
MDHLSLELETRVDIERRKLLGMKFTPTEAQQLKNGIALQRSQCVLCQTIGDAHCAITISQLEELIDEQTNVTGI